MMSLIAYVSLFVVVANFVIAESSFEFVDEDDQEIYEDICFRKLTFS
jgi:hypothetical protein